MNKTFYNAYIYMYGVPKTWHVNVKEDGTFSRLMSYNEESKNSVDGWHATDLPYIHELGPNGEFKDGYLWDSNKKCWRKDTPEEFINEVFH